MHPWDFRKAAPMPRNDILKTWRYKMEKFFPLFSLPTRTPTVNAIRGLGSAVSYSSGPGGLM